MMHSALFTVLPELWLLIVTSLSRSDLSRLSITCRRLLHIIRPILYQSVSLMEDCSGTDPTPTLALLARDTDLAKCVVELRLEKKSVFASTLTQHRYRPSLINIDTLANLLFLKRIVICGIIFRTAIEMREFGRVLCELPLEDFTFIGPTLLERWPGVDVDGIHGLRKIDWASRNWYYGEPVWNILPRSRTTIHTLSLHCPLDRASCYRLWNMHFPCLRSLTLGVCEPEGTDFIDFILAHNGTIEELEMEYMKYGRYTLAFNDLALTRLGPGSLPHLRSFKGSGFSLVIMVQAGMKCLNTTLQRLVVKPIKARRPMWEVRRMFDALLSPVTSGGKLVAGLPVLKEFDVDLSEWKGGEASDIIGTIGRCAECCGGSLEIWRMNFPHGICLDAEVIAESFGLFERLKVIYLPAGIIPSNKCKVEVGQGAYVYSLASRCRALEEVGFIYNLSFDKLEIAEWVVLRVSEQGAICSVRRRE